MGSDNSRLDLIAVIEKPKTNSLKVINLLRDIYNISIPAIDENKLESPTSEPVSLIL